MTTTAVIPAVRDLRRQLRQARRAHSDRTMGELLTDVYLVTFVGALYGGSAVVSIRRHLARQLEAPAGTQATRAWLILALLLTVSALAWRMLRIVGPLVTTPAAQAWCVSTPIDRAAWLLTPLTWLLAGSALLGAVVAVLAAWAGLSTNFWLAALAGAGFAVGLAGLAAVAQARPEPKGRLLGPDAVLIAGVVLVGAAVANRAAQVDLITPAIPSLLVAAAAAAGAVAAVRAARRALAHIDRTTLAGGAQLAGAAMSAAVMLDPSLLSGVVSARRWRSARRVHSRHWRPGGLQWVLFQADVLRQWRRKADLFVWAALILAPYAVAVFAPAAVGSVRVVAAYLAVDRLAGGLRTIARSPALRRSFGATDGALKGIHVVVPAVGLAVWWWCTLWAGGAPAAPLITLILTSGVLGAVYRTATRKPMSYDGGMADSPMGPIPTSLLRQTLRGPDLLAVVVLVGFLTSGLGTQP